MMAEYGDGPHIHIQTRAAAAASSSFPPTTASPLMENRRVNGHTILFMQVTDDVSRVYVEYKDTNACYYGMCEMFEETYKLKTKVDEVTYEITDVIQYFKSFCEVMLMIFDEELGHYLPRDINWITEQLEEYGKETDATAATKSGASGPSAGAGDEDVEFEEDWE